MKTRTVLFWSRRVKPLLNDPLLAADRVIEVPEEVDTKVVDKVAQRLTAVLREELATCREEHARLRVLQLGPSAFQGILEHVLYSLLTPVGGGLNVVKVRAKTEDAPQVEFDLDVSSQALSKFKDTDFDGPPSPDKRLFNDDLPATSEPPSGVTIKG